MKKIIARKNTEIKKVSRKLKKGFEAADMHVDIIV